MTHPTMDPKLHALLLERLAASDLDEDARAKVTAAAGPQSQPGAPGHPAGEVYLKSVTVEQFRGIGPAATLELKAQPGLTLVVGRNGSGKSSFAEGLELLLTGDTKRWASKTRNWASSWQCLHGDQATRIAAELVVAGEGEAVEVEQTWERGATHLDTTGRGAIDALLADRGWAEALTTFRPFLAYAELSSMFDKLTSLYAALSPILGLEAVDELLASISTERLGLENHAKQVKADAAALRASLATDDPREATLAELLAPTKPDVTAISRHLDAHPHGTSSTDESSAALRALARADVPDDEALRSQHDAVRAARVEAGAAAATDATRALATAELLTLALTLRDPQQLADNCAVCGTAGVLDARWAAASPRPRRPVCASRPARSPRRPTPWLRRSVAGSAPSSVSARSPTTPQAIPTTPAPSSRSRRRCARRRPAPGRCSNGRTPRGRAGSTRRRSGSRRPSACSARRTA